MSDDQVPEHVKHWYRRQSEITVIPTTGGGEFITIKGQSIQDIKTGWNDALVAITPDGEYYLLAEDRGNDLVLEHMLSQPFFQRISDSSIVNIKRIISVDIENRTVFFKDDSKIVEDEYWSDFIQKYENRSEL
ncbi:hypothetical protein D3C81_683150 [compost metagenome]